MKTTHGRSCFTLVVGLVALAGCGPTWQKVATGADCGGNDFAHTIAGSTPEPALCTTALKGKTAVCWDGGKFPAGAAAECIGTQTWCTYKNIAAASCTGGGNPGIVYECK